jgi:hypothetical protein
MLVNGRPAGLEARTQQIADWIEKLGMFEYTEPFARDHIDSDAIRKADG